MQYRKELVTPEMASEYLKMDRGHISFLGGNRIAIYADEMAKGRWIADTGETIKISKTGKLLDGSLRLHAVMEARTDVYLTIVTGVDDSVAKVLDSGLAKTGADVFEYAGIEDSELVYSIISQYKLFSNPQQRLLFLGGDLPSSVSFEEYCKRPEFWKAIILVAKKWDIQMKGILPIKIIGGLYALFSDLDKDLAFTFFEQFATGLLCNKNILLARNILMPYEFDIDEEDELENQMEWQHMQMGSIIIRAWNNCRKGVFSKTFNFNHRKDLHPQAI